MKRDWRIWAIVVLAVSSAQAEEPPQGLYEITYRVQVPHLERYAETMTQRVCISRGASLPVLSAKQAFVDCQVTERRASKHNLRYKLICEGVSAPRATALYRFYASGFKGHIDIKLGGKNMTLTERQNGRLLGPC